MVWYTTNNTKYNTVVGFCLKAATAIILAVPIVIKNRLLKPKTKLQDKEEVMKRKRLNQAQVFIVAMCLVLGVSLLGCPKVQLIAPYDQKIDQGVTDLQKQTAEFLIGIESQGGSKPGEFETHQKEFYNPTKVALSGLIVRSKARPLNTETSNQLELLKELFEKLELADKKHGISARAAALYETQFNQSFGYILSLEMKKQHPEAGGSGK
jgi:hypothetical protein